MHLRQEFEDLGAFVAAYRGNISREGALLAGASREWSAGARATVEIVLADSLVLIRGEAEVLGRDCRRDDTLVVRFISLDEQSGDLIDRLERRCAADGDEPFRLADVPLAQPSGPAQPVAGQAQADVATPEVSAEPTQPDGDVYEMVADALREEELVAPPEPIVAEPSFWRDHRGVLIVAGLVVVAAATVGMLGRPRHDDPVVHAPPVATAQPVVPATAFPAAAGTAVEPAPAETVPPRAAPTTPAPISPTPVSPVQVSQRLASRVEAVAWADDGDTTIVTIACDGIIERSRLKHARLGDPPRVLVRVVGVREAAVSPTIEVGGPRLDRIRAWHHTERRPPELHVVLDLTEGRKVEASVDVRGEWVEVTLVSGGQ